MTFQMIQSMESSSASSDLETVALSDWVPTEEELNAVIRRYDAGEELSEREYEAIERAAYGRSNPSDTLR